MELIVKMSILLYLIETIQFASVVRKQMSLDGQYNATESKKNLYVRNEKKTWHHNNKISNLKYMK